MQLVQERPAPAAPSSGASLSAGLHAVALPTFWLTVGLLACFAYKHAADFTPMTSAGLPHPFFPAQAVILAVLLMTPVRHWWLYLAVYYVMLVAEGVWWSDLPSWYLLVSNVANVMEPLVGALLLHRFISLPPRFDSLYEVGVYVACVAAASALGASWGAMARMIAGFSVWPSLRGWFLADVLASLVLTPTILLCISGRVWSPRIRSRRRAAEAGVLLLALLAVGAFVFGTQTQNKDTAPALLYLPVPVLVWAAVRFGPRGLACALSLATVLAIFGVVNGLGPFVELPVFASIFQLQLFLLGVGVPLFCLAVLVQEHQRATELAISEAALRATNAQLAELSRAKSDFLSIVSHEVRTPLGSIRGFSEMIRDDTLEPPEVVEYASLINGEAQRLGRLVNDLLDLDRLESGRIELRVESIDLRAIVAEAFEQARPTADGHVLHAVLAPGIPELRGDPDKLTQVVENLVGNAIKYSPNGGTVTLGADVAGDDVHLWVRDEGIGVPPEMLEAIFDRYARVESAEHRAIKGTGLGLPIVRQIAELHGGRAWAERAPGTGSIFHVLLPIDGVPARPSNPAPSGEGMAR
jgi:signal transduction histidine kinase